jgi:hypothetical protein
MTHTELDIVHPAPEGKIQNQVPELHGNSFGWASSSTAEAYNAAIKVTRQQPVHATLQLVRKRETTIAWHRAMKSYTWLARGRALIEQGDGACTSPVFDDKFSNIEEIAAGWGNHLIPRTLASLRATCLPILQQRVHVKGWVSNDVCEVETSYPAYPAPAVENDPETAVEHAPASAAANNKVMCVREGPLDNNAKCWFRRVLRVRKPMRSTADRDAHARCPVGQRNGACGTRWR